MSTETQSPETEDVNYLPDTAIYNMFRKMDDRVTELEELVEDLEQENERLRAEVRHSRSTEAGSKKERAQIRSARILLAKVNQGSGGLSGVLVKLEDVRKYGELNDEESFHPQTVYNAWNALVEEWSFLSIRPATDEKKKALKADRENVSEAFRKTYSKVNAERGE